MNTLILGMGNLLLGDEGVGVHAARALLKGGCLPGTEILEIGTGILDALPAMETAERIIIIDAMKGQAKAGAVYRIALDNCSGNPCIASMHGFDIFRVLALTQRSSLPEVVVFGVEPDHIGWSMELSPSVARSLPALVEAVNKEII
jgi:hydrogenase maturation protease